MFMQNNSLSSANELRRSGRLVYKKTLWLAKDSSKDVHRWEDYSIDLAGLIHQEPGAIYRVILSFRQEYSAYPCGGSENKEMQFADNKSSDNLTKVSGETLSEDDEAVWDTPETYYYYNGSVPMDWSQYRWTERDNPCHPSYYMNSDRIAACNIFASNLGMIVKRNSLNKLWIAVNNILDTKPVAKAQVTIYNFQLQPIGKGETNGEGLVEITPKGVPFIAVAEADKQKAYVRVVDGEEQSVSRFDVEGKDIQKGLKGFVYGERGVWRPGDTLHISFMLEDREKRIPDKHPVALEIYNPRGQFYTKMISTQGTNGFYTFAVPTQADDPTGLWNAYVKVGGTAFHKGAAHRNHQAEPSEDYAGFANHPSGFEQRRICPAYFFMADGSHRIATESKGRNVLIESQYAVQELRTIPVQQSGNGLYDRPGGCVQRGTGWGRKSRRQHTASGSNGCSGYAECNAHHPCLRTGRRCKHLLADCSLLSVHIVCGHQSEPAERKVYRNRQRSCV